MGEVKREGVRRFEMSVHPEPEVPYSVRPIPDEHGAFTYWGTWMDDHALSMTMKTDEDEPVEHSVDLDILAQTIGEHISFNPDEYDFARDIADALKAEFKGQSVHMRENEPVANHEAPTRISDLAGSRLEPGQ